MLKLSILLTLMFMSITSQTLCSNNLFDLTVMKHSPARRTAVHIDLKDLPTLHRLVNETKRDLESAKRQNDEERIFFQEKRLRVLEEYLLSAEQQLAYRQSRQLHGMVVTAIQEAFNRSLIVGLSYEDRCKFSKECANICKLFIDGFLDDHDDHTSLDQRVKMNRVLNELKEPRGLRGLWRLKVLPIRVPDPMQDPHLRRLIFGG